MSITFTTLAGRYTVADGQVDASPAEIWPGIDEAWDLVALDGQIMTPSMGVYEQSDLEDEGAVVTLVRSWVMRSGDWIVSEAGEYPEMRGEHVRIGSGNGVEVFHLQGQHDQLDHGNRGGTAVLDGPLSEPVEMDAAAAVDMLVEIGRADRGVVDLTNLSLKMNPYLFKGVPSDGRRSRGEMPQVPEASLRAFHDHLEAEGVTFTNEIIDPASVKSTQTELDATKVGQMIDRVLDGNYTTGHDPWVSNDGYILDGHHRWATMALLSAAGIPHPPFNVQRVSLPIDELLTLADEFNAQNSITRKTIDMSASTSALAGLDVDEFGIGQFHLQGQHDQQTHAGGRAAAQTINPADKFGPDSTPADRDQWLPLHAAVKSDRPVEFNHYESAYRVTAADGNQVTAKVFADPEQRDTLASVEWQQRTVDGLNGVVDGYEAAPTEVPPQMIVVTKLPAGLPIEAQGAIAMVRSSGGNIRIRPADSIPLSADFMAENEVLFNASPIGQMAWREYEANAAKIMMPSVTAAGVARYTGAHEYGHVRAGDDNISFITQLYDDMRPQSLSNISPEWKALSQYGKTNPAEAHAEAFADWVMTDGRSDNAATRLYAGWLWERDEALAAAAGATQLRHQWVWCLDTPNGGILVTKAADGVQFHLEGTENDHDQQTHAGGAAGKGGLPDEFKVAPNGYTESAQAEWAAGAAYLAENEMPDWWVGLDYLGEDGLPVGKDMVGHNWEAEDINKKLEKFREEVGPDVDAGIWMIGRAAESRRKEAIAAAISMNQISLEDADARYGRDAEPDRGEWLDLPDTLYHATSALGAISADGALKSRREIGGMNSAAGLGGGTDNTISFTSDRKIAEDIARSLHEVHRALNLPKDEFIAELKERAGDWWSTVEEYDRNVNGVSTWDTTEERFNLYRIFAGERERRDGVLDPLFFGVNPNTLRDMNPADIGIVEVTPAVTGAKGYQVSALGEWRTPTGAATEITRIIEVEDPGKFSTETADLAVQVFHLQGQHDQKDHGRRGGSVIDSASALAEPDSGFTRAADTLRPVTTGWAVALGGTDRLVAGPDAFKNGRPTERIKRMLVDRIDAAMSTPVPEGTKRAVGAWHNPADGKIEINVTAVFPSDQRDAALSFAQDQDQIAMANLDAITAGDWDNAIVNTGGTGGAREVEDD